MRGGSLPLLAWGTLLLVLLTINWIWTGDAIQVGQFGFAVLVIYGGALSLWLSHRESLRRGPPEQSADPEGVPQASAGAMLVGISVGSILFGMVWARFLVYFGIGMLLASLGRVGLELRSERRSLQERRR